jgi:N-acylneuraminate cytidylyltransferase
MASDATSVAVIPARGGSKRIPRKNARPFCGVPMIARSIATALESRLFERVIVSTDDPDIAALARGAGAETPFARPAHLADDHASTVDVMRHAADWLAESGTPADLVCCIYATAPFLRSADLVRAREMLLANPDAGICVPVTEYVFPIQRALRMDASGRVAMFDPAHMVTRSQDLERAWHDTGQFYYAALERWRGGEAIFGPGCLGLPIEPWRVQDIDTPDDWKRAELLFAQLQLD